MPTTVAPDAKRNYFNVSELIAILILYSYISNMAAPTLARAGRRKQKSYLLFKRADSCARTKKNRKTKNEGKMGRIGNYNLYLQEYFKALEKVDFRDCLDLKQQ